MSKRNKGVKKFSRSRSIEKGGTETDTTPQINGTPAEKTTPSLATKRRRVHKVKNKSKVKSQKEPKIPDQSLLKDREDDRNSLSSNWKEFMKEVGKQRKQGDLIKNELKTGQKRKASKKYGKNADKRRKQNTEESNTADDSILNASDIWFDDVDIEDIEHAIGKKLKFKNDKYEKPDVCHDGNSNADVDTPSQKPSITKRLAIDCEMVGVGIDGKESMLARVSIVNAFGDTVYDTFVAPMQTVVDYRTEFSGVRPQDVVNAPQFKDVQRDVANITNGKILVGHAIRNDLKALLLSHSRKNIRDTSTYKPFKKLLKTKLPSLKRLAREVLNIDIQSGEHSSVEDAKYTMKIYQLHKRKWESSLKQKGYKDVIEDTSKIFIGRNSEYHKKRFKRLKRIQRQRFKKRKS